MLDFPKVISVEPLDNYMLSLRFENGETRIFDVKPYIRGSWYGQLQDIHYFRSVRIANRTTEWPDGQDLAPHCLYEDSIPVEEMC